MEEDTPPSTNFIPCVKWVRRGVAKANPVKVELSKQELENLIKGTRGKLNLDENDDSGNENDEGEISPSTADDEYNLENYDNEGGDTEMNVGDVAVYDNEDPYKIDEDEPDSDEEDDIIKPDDNLVVVGHVEGDASILEIYIHNENEDSVYVHHDIILPSIPLTLEWLNYDPENVNRSACLCAVGYMSPIIDVWDLDVVNSIEAAFQLGKKGSKRNGTPRIGHKDAVLDLSWNTNLTHILASGSVDRTVLLWDLEVKKPSTSLTLFEEKVQTLQWHPFEGQTLAVGSSDKTCKVFDCRTSDVHKSWVLDGEVERVIWNHFNPYCFFCSDDKGFVYCFDCRQENLLWKLSAHSKETTGLVLSAQCPGFLATASPDESCKIWDVSEAEPVLVHEKSLRIGAIQCLDIAPDSPFLLVSGGDNKNKNLLMFNALDISAVNAKFGARELVAPVVVEGTPGVSTSLVRTDAIEKKSKPKENSLSVIKKKKKFKTPK